jgi:hypothetical protein
VLAEGITARSITSRLAEGYGGSASQHEPPD